MVKTKPPGKRLAWLDAFPLPEASDAVDAVVAGWVALAATRKKYFNRTTNERDLTDVLAAYLTDVMPNERKLPGQWGSENAKAKVNFATCEIKHRIRTDITYLWNDATTKIALVFEFKKLNSKAPSRRHYFGEKGMCRFVTGYYSVKEPLALMVGVLVEDKDSCVLPLQRALQQDRQAGKLEMCKHDGKYLIIPSEVFSGRADFDTEHARTRDKAPAHGTIRMSHVFVEFGYPASQDDR